MPDGWGLSGEHLFGILGLPDPANEHRIPAANTLAFSRSHESDILRIGYDRGASKWSGKMRTTVTLGIT